uniref:Uncharacterized protein n=1 Tax=Romanomermis culicivorax TaxID=13658 RepID=A0A915KXD1_ROMCU
MSKENDNYVEQSIISTPWLIFSPTVSATSPDQVMMTNNNGKWALHSASVLVCKLTDDNLRKLYLNEKRWNLAVRQMANIRCSILALRNIATGAVLENYSRNFMKTAHLDQMIASLVHEKEKAQKAE